MLIETRVHGRGGQGGVTCAKILAAFRAHLGNSVQTFGDYSGERSGAPVRAYVRASDTPVTNRNKVYDPDDVLVLDPTLLATDILTGLKPGGGLLINTPDSMESFQNKYESFRLGVVDATEIARRHEIGTRSVVIVNTTIAGAYAKMFGIPMEILTETYKDLGFESNLDAAKEAYEAVDFREALSPASASVNTENGTHGSPPVLPLTEHISSQETGLETGTWRTQVPQYVQRLSPCSAWCPAGNDVIGFVRALVTDGIEKAAEILYRTTPLPSVCGRVCPAFCMEGCNRAELDGAVNIRGLERWVGDNAEAPEWTAPTPDVRRNIGVIGSGPAGLSAAFSLAQLGHKVTIYEGEMCLGGVLRTGIPEYRLPEDVLDREIQRILDMGVQARCGTYIDMAALRDLKAAHDGLIFAVGLQGSRELNIPGRELEGIFQGIDFLAALNLQGVSDLVGEVVVVGGGNTAMDCARSALRSGADRVTVVYRRTRQDMPAISEEIREAMEEGINFVFQRQPVGFDGEGHVSAIRLAEVELGEPDDSGRRRPITTNRIAMLECDTVLLALGQTVQVDWLPDDWRIAGLRIEINDIPAPIFLAGDTATEEGTVTHAIGHGRQTATLLLSELGDEVEVFEPPRRARSVPVNAMRLENFERAQPHEDLTDDPGSRIKTFNEVNYGLADSSEAIRCMSCGQCTMCDTCLVYCPEGIVFRRDNGYRINYTICKGCGICVVECPRGAMEMVSE